MGMASGKVARLIFHKSIVMEKTAKKTDALRMFAVPAENVVIVVTIDSIPASPDPNMYIALCYQAFYNTVQDVASTSILRPNGTYGTDSAMVIFNRATGELVIGGEWGCFPEGTRYNIYEIEVG